MSPALLLAAALTAAPAQPPVAAPFAPSFRHYGVVDGLPSDAAYTVTQDHQGYIWIGTRDGLARFDAQTFRIFRHDPNDNGSLLSNDVSVVLIDRQGRVWAGGEGNGLNLFQPQSGRFSHWLHDSRNARSLSGNDVMALTQSSDGAIWVGVYGGGLNRLQTNDGRFEHLHHRGNDANGLLSDNVTALAADTRGGVWVGSEAGLQYRDARGRFATVVLPSIDKPVSVWQLNALANGVDAATDAGLFHVDDKLVARRVDADTAAYASLREANGDVWIARQDGVHLIGADGNTRHYAPHAGSAGALPGALAVGLLRDREGGTWIALLDGGVAYLPPGWRAFDAWRHWPDTPSSLTLDRVRALTLAPDGSLLAGGAKGVLERVDPGNGDIRHLADAAGLQNSSISALAQDTRGRIWIGHRHGLRVLDGTQVHDVGADDPTLRHGVWALLVTRVGAVYFTGVGTGVTRVDPQTFALTPLGAPAQTNVAREVKQLREAADGAIWSAGAAGVAR